MGTPAFAVASLEALVNAGFDIVGVVTAPDKPAGRGMKLTGSDVKNFAIAKGLTLLQPEKLKSPVFIEQLTNLKADLQVVVAFRMLPEIVWSMPPLGTINLHGSLLPQYRGAAPINWAIINGEIETGVTTFKLQHEIDTGNILLQEKLPIGENETAGEVHDKMMKTGASLLVKTIQGIAEGSLTGKPQQITGETIKHAPKIYTDTCKINWENNITTIHNLIRGLSPYPGAFTSIDNKTLKIYKSLKTAIQHNKQPGTLESDGKTFLRFAASDGYIEVLQLQLEGKKKMETAEFLKGFRFK
jgi:methionyl-tRNA formyltransferase